MLQLLSDRSLFLVDAGVRWWYLVLNLTPMPTILSPSHPPWAIPTTVVPVPTNTVPIRTISSPSAPVCLYSVIFLPPNPHLLIIVYCDFYFVILQGWTRVHFSDPFQSNLSMDPICVQLWYLACCWVCCIYMRNKLRILHYVCLCVCVCVCVYRRPGWVG